MILSGDMACNLLYSFMCDDDYDDDDGDDGDYYGYNDDIQVIQADKLM